MVHGQPCIASCEGAFEEGRRAIRRAREMAREQWERLAFPDAVRHYEDIGEVLDKIIMSHTRMYKTGNFREGDVDSQRREMQDLRRKVPNPGDPMSVDNRRTSIINRHALANVNSSSIHRQFKIEPRQFLVNSSSIPRQFLVNSSSIPRQFLVNSPSIPRQFIATSSHTPTAQSAGPPWPGQPACGLRQPCRPRGPQRSRRKASLYI